MYVREFFLRTHTQSKNSHTKTPLSLSFLFSLSRDGTTVAITPSLFFFSHSLFVCREGEIVKEKKTLTHPHLHTCLKSASPANITQPRPISASLIVYIVGFMRHIKNTAKPRVNIYIGWTSVVYFLSFLVLCFFRFSSCGGVLVIY